MSDNGLQNLGNRLENKIEKVEDKVEKLEDTLNLHIQQQSKTETDLLWVKNYLKLSLTVILALMGGLITTLIEVFFK